MQEKSSTFQIPFLNNGAPAPAPTFLETHDQEVFAELNSIAEEIDRCRASGLL